MRQMNREEFINLCKITLDKLEDDMIHIMKRMGMSGNFNEYYRTDSNEYRTLTQVARLLIYGNVGSYIWLTDLITIALIVERPSLTQKSFMKKFPRNLYT